ncbi:expressed protein [Phakopsora pachyrhizi]|uniref:Expressed protein n=1 Tax=Phakopsora pachyrhizi TaxID=170000 RepID=A0AAV0BM27_PHAPC|nr:expressed protein [Phakopsora pachyrhizi]
MEFFPVSPADYQDASCTSSKSQLNELESHQVSMYPYDISPAALHQSEPFQSLSSQPHCNLSVSLAKSEGYPIQTTTAIPELVFLGDDSFNTDILNGEIIDGIQEDQDFPKTPIFLEQLRTPSPCKNHGATTGTDLSISLSPSSRKALNYDDLFFSYTQPIQSMGNFEAGCSLDYGYPFLIAERFPKSDLYDYDYNNQNNLNELFSPHISQAVMSPKNVDWCQEVLLGSKSEPLTVTAEARKDSDSKPENHDHNGSLRGFGMLHHDFHNSRPPTAFLLSEGLVDRELGGYIEGEATDPQRFAEQETLKSNKSCFFMCKDPSKPRLPLSIYLSLGT